MLSKNLALAGASLATLGLLFGASAAQASVLDPAVKSSAMFEHVVVPTDNNNNNNNKKGILSLSEKPASLAELAASLA
jgi:hypothetical protein